MSEDLWKVFDEAILRELPGTKIHRDTVTAHVSGMPVRHAFFELPQNGGIYRIPVTIQAHPLSEKDAKDLAAQCLSLLRPAYEPSVSAPSIPAPIVKVPTRWPMSYPDAKPLPAEQARAIAENLRALLGFSSRPRADESSAGLCAVCRQLPGEGTCVGGCFRGKLATEEPEDTTLTALRARVAKDRLSRGDMEAERARLCADRDLLRSQEAIAQEKADAIDHEVAALDYLIVEAGGASCFDDEGDEQDD